MSALTTRQLCIDREADIRDLQAVLDNSTYYSISVDGVARSPNAARELLCELPPGKTVSDKLVLGICDETRLIGCVDIVRGFPETHIAYLGLLLFAESAQGRGYGPWTLNLIEDICTNWVCTQLRLAVVETNVRGLAFWRREGFTELYRKPTNTGVAIVMQRSNPLLHTTAQRFAPREQ